jgi:membrane protease subunit HflC
MFTSDKKNVTVDMSICWKIAEPPEADAGRTGLVDRPVVRFYRGLGGAELAEARLESRLRSILTAAVGQVELSRLLGVRDSEKSPDKTGPDMLEQLADLVRAQTAQRPDEAASLRERLGVEIVDVRITRLNLPAGNQQAVFERMKSERKKIADRYRSAGLADNQMIKSQADRQYNELLAKAQGDAERIRGAAEAEAVRILNTAHAQDPEFYTVLATLDAYRKILNEKTTLVLSASSSLMKLLTEGVPPLKAPAVAPAPRPAGPAPAKAADKTAQGDRVSGLEGTER